MPRGGYRPGAGRKKKTRTPPVGKPAAAPDSQREPAPTESTVGKDPLEYMLAVIRDPLADQERKDRLAIAAAPFMHAKVGDAGKKEAKAGAAKKASSGRFASAAPPKAAR